MCSDVSVAQPPSNKVPIFLAPQKILLHLVQLVGFILSQVLIFSSHMAIIAAGADGLPGRSGRSGLPGIKGDRGRDGADGQDGFPGVDGSSLGKGEPGFPGLPGNVRTLA